MDLIEIANSGLIKAGGNVIMSLTDDSREGRLANNRFKSDMRTVLRWHPWNCAMARVELSPLVTTPAFGYSQQFQMPSDLLRLSLIEDVEDFRIEGRLILCDESTIDIKYVKDPGEAVAELDQLCTEAIATYFAWDICYALVQSNSLRASLWVSFMDIFRHAKSVDSKEDMMSQITANEWDDSRSAGA